MASINPRSKATGVSWRVVWRENPGDKQSVRTLHDENQARDFHYLVEKHGDKMPPREQLEAFGLTFVLGEPEPDLQAPPVITVSEAVLAYIDYKENRTTDRPSTRTLKEYRGLHKNYVKGTALGAADVAICDAEEELDAWQLEQLRRPKKKGAGTMSPNSILKAKTFLSSMFAWAQSNKGGKLRELGNPIAGMDRLRKDLTYTRDILYSPEEYQQFFDAAYGGDPDWADMMLAQAGGGLRFGEVTALPVEAVDFAAGGIWLKERFSGGLLEKGTKNHRVRFVALPAPMMERVLRPRCAGHPSRALVFPGPAGQRWATTTEGERWDKVNAELGWSRHFTGHCLRHGYRTHLTSAGIVEAKVELAMGHAKDRVGRLYDQLTPQDWARIIAAIEPFVIPALDKWRPEKRLA